MWIVHGAALCETNQRVMSGTVVARLDRSGKPCYAASGLPEAFEGAWLH